MRDDAGAGGLLPAGGAAPLPPDPTAAPRPDRAPVSPQLDLAFTRHPHAGTQLSGRRAGYPYVVTGSFRLDAPQDRLSVIVQSSAGAVLAGDRLHQRLSFGPGTNGRVSTEAAMPVHRMAGGEWAGEHLAVDVAAGGFAEVLPAPRILFPGAELHQSLDLTVAETGVLILSDGVTRHDPTGAGALFRRHSGTMTLRRPDGRLLASDAFDLTPPGGFGGATGLRAHGVLMIVAAGVDGLCPILEAAAGACHAAAAALPRGCGVALRLVAADGSRLRDATRAAADAARLALTGQSAPRPRG